MNATQLAFFELLRSGLWEQGARLGQFPSIDYKALYYLAGEQSVIGLVTAGLEHVEDVKVTRRQFQPFLKKMNKTEELNMAMDFFVALITEDLRKEGIFSILVKGQGVAQSYERPLWRMAGDVDLLLDDENYEKAKAYLIPLASSVDEEDKTVKHLGLNVAHWVVELHGSFRGGISKRANKVIDTVQADSIAGGNTRIWHNGESDIFLPSPDNDIIFVFSHFLNHFFYDGIGLRQICDWCRLLWTFRDTLDINLLECRIKEMSLMTEWKAFAAYAVDYLGMPASAMPFYDKGRRWSQKARRINSFILIVGNFGHNRDDSFYKKYPYLVYKAISLWRHIEDFFRHLAIFPKDSIQVLWNRVVVGFRTLGNDVKHNNPVLQ